jgi:glycosyltransferase involved in cell wall biosynthesis
VSNEGSTFASDGRRPKLLILASTFPRWSGDHEPGFVHELAKRLVRRFEVLVLCPHARGAKPSEELDGVRVVRYRYAPEFLELLVNDGGIVTNLRRRPWTAFLVPGFLLAQSWGLWRINRRFRPDVVHAHWLIPQGFIVAAMGGKRMPPFLVTSHGADLFALRGRILRAFKRFVLRRAAMTTVVSEGMRDEISRLGIDPAEVCVEPMGVDLRERFQVDAATVRSRTELLFVGRLVEKKGLRHLLDAMPAILASRTDVTLTVVGFGPEDSERRLQAEQLGIADRVSFVGAVRQEELPRHYRRAAVFVAPFVPAKSGDQEGLGLVLVEALGCGCPVVVSDLPAVRDLASLPGIPMQLTAAGDPSSLAEGVLRALAASNGPGVQPAGIAGYDWGTRADRYANLLEGLIKR